MPRLELRRDGILSTHVGTIAVRGRQKTDNWTGNDLYERDRANASSLPTLNLAPCTDVTTGGGDGGGDDEDLGDLFDLFG